MITPPFPPDRISFSQLESFIKRRKKVLTAFTISGGEPTLFPYLPELTSYLKEQGFKVKIDTNGLRPAALKEVTMDYLALDIKTTGKKAKLIGCPEELCYERELAKTIETARNKEAFIEGRSVVTPPLLEEKDLQELFPLLSKVDRYALTPFRPGNTLDSTYGVQNVPSRETLDKILEHLKSKGIEAIVRG